MLCSPKFTSLYVQSIFCKFPNFHELNIFKKSKDMDQFDSLENITLFDCDTAYIYTCIYI